MAGYGNETIPSIFFYFNRFIEKKLDCCIECDDLTACDKDLWRRLPKFKEEVVELQVKYR